MTRGKKNHLFLVTKGMVDGKDIGCELRKRVTKENGKMACLNSKQKCDQNTEATRERVI